MPIVLTPEAQAALFATTTGDVFTWLTGWLPAIAADEGFATLKLKNMAGNMRCVLATQVAKVRTDAPGAPTLLAGFTPHSTSAEFFYTDTDIGLSTLVAGQTFIRFGVGHHVSAAGTGTADAALQVAMRQRGRLLAPWSGHLVAVSTTSQFTPITAWMPSASVEKFAVTYVLGSPTGNFRLNFAYRTAATSPEDPDAWTGTQVGNIASGSDNTGELTPATTNKMWIQIGVECLLSSVSAPGNGDVTALVGIRETV